MEADIPDDEPIVLDLTKLGAGVDDLSSETDVVLEREPEIILAARALIGAYEIGDWRVIHECCREFGRQIHQKL